MAIKKYSKAKEKKNELSYEVIKKFGVLDSDSKMPKELRLISWNGSEPKYDLRGWGVDDEGNEKMTKGITLDGEELQSLLDILKQLDEEAEGGNIDE